MLKEKLMKHIETAKQAFIVAYNAIDIETNRHNEEIAKLRKQNLDLSKEGYEKRHTAEVTLHNSTMKKINDDLQESINAVVESYMQEVQTYYMPTGADLNAEDCALLNSGIILSTEEIMQLIAKHGDNVTMLRTIESYVRNHEKEIKLPYEQQAIIMKAKRPGSSEKEILTRFLQLAGNCVRMGMQGFAGSEQYINSQMRLEEYVKQTENELTKAKVFIDAETRAEIDKYNEEKMQRQNKAKGYNA